ncbi:MAG TPA: cell surface protein SprA, partial [Saprospiraceae bacterium]|nr:cell surface protein SprA [Saprospiraceae bacterium]
RHWRQPAEPWQRVTFRFATLELGRNQWRRFKQNLADPVNFQGCDIQYTRIPFDVNAVSIEENSARLPFNYTIPFGIQREQSVGAFPSIQQNEQALSMTICDLQQCDARGIFKTLNMDLRQFDRLKMFAHLEGRGADRNHLDSSDLTIFVRLGSDFVRNYYEYEIPLYPSNENSPVLGFGPDDERYKKEVWRDQNTFDFPLELLTDVKTKRNAQQGANFEIPFEMNDPDPLYSRNKVKIVGNPNLGYVKGVMIGVRNVDPDKDIHCFEVWVNEMRLNGFNEKGGYAGQARLDMKLADLGNLSFSGNYTSIGWGTIEQKLVQRQREEVLQGDASLNLELGRFLGEKSPLRLPFYAQYSNVTRNPEYDPYDLDIKLKDKIRNEPDAAKRDSIRTVAQDVAVTRGFNFTNVRLERKGGPRKVPMPWNIENYSITYAFNQTKRRTPFLINDQQNQHKGALDWQYATGMKPIMPFKKLIKNDKYLKFLSEFNFNPLPNTYGFNTQMERVAAVTTYRFAGEDPSLNTYYNRRFTWDRNYDLGWDITKSLRFNYDATARSIIDEPYQTKPDGVAYTKAERRDSILTNIRKLGRPKNYTHNASLNYTLPFKLFPLMDWVTMRASYTAGYTWTAQSLKLQNLDAGQYQYLENSRDLGNVIQNNNVRQINGEFNFEGLYNKSKYLARINKPGKPGSSGGGKNNKNTPGGGPGGSKPGGRGDTGAPSPGGGGDLTGGDLSDKRSSKDSPANNDRKKNSEPAPAALNPAAGGGGVTDGKAGATPTPGPGGKNADALAGGKDVKGKAKKGKDEEGEEGGSKKKKDRQPSMAERIALRPLMLVRKARFTYSENYSTVIPGFTPEPKLLGQNQGFASPGWGFIAGVQPDNRWLDEAGANGYITHRPELNQQVTRNYTQNLDAGVTIEPFQDFRIELNANKQYTRNNTELFKDQNFNLSPDSVRFEHRAQRDLGSYTVSYFALNTLFNNDINGLFARYAAYRPIISQRLGVEVGNTDPHIKSGSEYAYGYGRFHQQVLIPAFIAAYTDADPNKVGLNIFRTRPAVNWKLNYNGLSKVGKLKKIFSSVQIQHGYKSTLQVNSYNTDIFYQGTPVQTNYSVEELNADYIARFEIPQVVINEQFQPLLGIDVKLKNDMTFKVDFKKQRTLAMSFIDYQLAETRSTSYSAGFGHRIRNVNIPFLTGKKSGAKGKSKKKSSKKKKTSTKPTTGPTPPPGSTTGQQANDLNIKFDFEVRDDITMNHRLDQATQAEPTRGQRTISLNPSVEYALNKRLKLRLFTDYRKTVPKTSQSFPITTLNTGVTIQFSLN